MVPLLAVSVLPTAAMPEIVGRPVAGELVTSVLMAILTALLNSVLQSPAPLVRLRDLSAMLHPVWPVWAFEVVSRTL